MKTMMTKTMLLAAVLACPAAWGEGLAVNAVLVEVPSGRVAKALMAHVPGAKTDAKLWANVERLVKSGEGKFVATMRAVVAAGSRGKSESGAKFEYVSGYGLDGARLVEEEREEVFVGTRLEVDPKLSDDGKTVLVRLALQHELADPVMRPVKVAVDDPPGSGGKVALPVFHREVYSTSVRVPVGVPTLAGSVTPEAGVCHLMFVRAEVTE